MRAAAILTAWLGHEAAEPIRGQCACSVSPVCDARGALRSQGTRRPRSTWASVDRTSCAPTPPGSRPTRTARKAATAVPASRFVAAAPASRFVTAVPASRFVATAARDPLRRYCACEPHRRYRGLLDFARDTAARLGFPEPGQQAVERVPASPRPAGVRKPSGCGVGMMSSPGRTSLPASGDSRLSRPPRACRAVPSSDDCRRRTRVTQPSACSEARCAAQARRRRDGGERGAAAGSSCPRWAPSRLPRSCLC